MRPVGHGPVQIQCRPTRRALPGLPRRIRVEALRPGLGKADHGRQCRAAGLAAWRAEICRCECWRQLRHGGLHGVALLAALLGQHAAAQRQSLRGVYPARGAQADPLPTTDVRPHHGQAPAVLRVVPEGFLSAAGAPHELRGRSRGAQARPGRQSAVARSTTVCQGVGPRLASRTNCGRAISTDAPPAHPAERYEHHDAEHHEGLDGGLHCVHQRREREARGNAQGLPAADVVRYRRRHPVVEPHELTARFTL